MSYLPHTTGSPRACFSDLTLASSVCRRWRSIALTSQELWSVVHCPSHGELGALGAILPRSGKSPLHIEMDLRSAPGYLRATAISAVTEHMHRIELLILTHDVVSKKDYERLLSTRAPLLHTLQLHSPKRFQIRADFLGGHAPRLKTLALALLPGALPPACPALAAVAELHILAPGGAAAAPSIDDARHLFALCPRLRAVRLDSKLADAPAHGPVPAPLAEFAGVRDLTLSERGAEGAITLMIPTLKLFSFAAAPRVHLRAATESTAGFLVKPSVTVGLKSAFVARAASGDGAAHVVVLRDTDARSRALSELTSQTFDFLLKKVWAAAVQLTALALSEHMPAGDAVALAGHSFRVLRTFSVFVQDAPPPTPHILDVYQTTRRQWEFPALAELVFETRAPVRDVFPEAGTRPVLSASRILAFYTNMIQAGVRRRPRLILDGVVFRERFAGPEVNALRETFSEVVVYP